jgi:small nuclear ribonucleoprotein (snRNP)-like protein
MFKTRAEFEGKIYRYDAYMSVVCKQSKEFVDDCLQRHTEPGGDVGSVDTKQAGHVVRTGGRERHTTFTYSMEQSPS